MTGNKCDREVMSKFLNDILAKEDITKKRLAELIGIVPHRMYKYLLGEVYPNNDDYDKIQKYVGLSFDEFWDITHEDWRFKHR